MRSDCLSQCICVLLFLCLILSTPLWAVEAERSRWNTDERHICQHLKECVDRHQAVPTMEQMESLPGGSPGPEARARLCSCLYHEHGIIGALLSDDEDRIIDYLFHQRRKLGHEHELALRIRSALGGLTIQRIQNALSFLREAGYVEIRHDEGDVYLVIPRGQNILHRAIRTNWQATGASAQTWPYQWQGLPRQDTEGSPPTSGVFSHIETSQNTPSQPEPVLHRSDVLPQVTGAAGLDNRGPTPAGQNHERPVSPSVSGTVTPGCTRILPPHKDGKNRVERERRRTSGAPDRQGWPLLLGQSTYDLRVTTSDTYEDVSLSVRDGRLTSCLPPDIIVFNGGEPEHIYFFRAMENLRLWREDHPHIRGKVMTLPETISWAGNQR